MSRRGHQIRTLCLAASLCLALATPAHPAQESDADRLLKDAQAAIDAENYDGALRILEDAKKVYPRNPSFPSLLGDIYEEKDFPSLALDEFRLAQNLRPNDPDILYKLSVALGKLNRERESIAVLERVHAMRPEDSAATGDLGWMYFKVHQLQKGAKLLTQALNSYGPNSNYSMTLGTIYSELYEYDQSRSSYLVAIKDGLKSDSKNFVAVAYYNLALLEEKYYRFPKAMDYGAKSVSTFERPSGHLARGELFLRQQNIRAAFSEFKQAYNLDTSPLSEINLANTQRCAGRIEESIAYLDGVMKSKNLSWMLNYGTDLKTHYKDLHEIYKDDYAALAILERCRASGSLFESVARFFRAVRDDIYSYYHRQMYRSYSRDIADYLMKENNFLNAMISYYDAYQGYPAIALKYLGKAKDFETSVIPEAAASYELEEGLLHDDYGKLKTAYEHLDPAWERDGIARALQRLCLIARSRGDGDSYRAYAERLFTVNPGALLQGGIGLPLVLDVRPDSAGNGKRAEGLRRSLSDLFSHAKSPLAGKDEALEYRYRFAVTVGSDGVDWALVDSATGATLIKEKARLQSLSRRNVAALFNGILDSLYRSD
jgi:tetratricopeptide (TPR) repeat protein